MNSERLNELYEMWENERDDDEWRDSLTPAELAAVEKWDDQFEQGIARMITEMRGKN